MFLNIYQKLIQQCQFFIIDLKRSDLLKDYSHLIVDIDKYSRSISSATNNGLDINSNLDSIDFSWHERLKDLINDNNLDNESEIYTSINFIDKATEVLKTHNYLKNKVRQFSNGYIILENEDYFKSLIETKNYPLISSIENLESKANKVPQIISDFSKIENDYRKIEKDIENNFRKIKLEILESEKKFEKSIEEKINHLFSEKIDTIQNVYQKTLTLNSDVAGKIISNDFSKSSMREKFWADWLRISGFVILFLCAFILYEKSGSFNLVDPTKISAIDYINLIKTSAVGIF